VIADARRALPLTFLVYMLEALVGALAALAPADAWAPALAAAPWQESDTAALLERAPALLLSLVSHGRVALGALGALALLGPWLQLAWLRALAAPTSVAGALRSSARLVPRAWLVSLLVALAVAIAAAPWAVGAWGLHRLLEHTPDARLHDLALAAVLAPLAPIALWAYALHDLARAAALTEPARAALRTAWRASRHAHVLGTALALALAGQALVLAAGTATLALRGRALDAALSTLVLQSALLGRLALRSVWLARALARVRARA